jgi:hypothetical protein
MDGHDHRVFRRDQCYFPAYAGTLRCTDRLCSYFDHYRVHRVHRHFLPNAADQDKDVVFRKTPLLACRPAVNWTAFLQTFSTSVADWNTSPVEPARLDGNLAARGTWAGKFHRFPTRGVMYIVVLGKESCCLHVFGRSDVPNPTLQSSIRVVEHLRAAKASMLLEDASAR